MVKAKIAFSEKHVEMWPGSVENPFYSTSGIFKPISGLCRSH
jgi:hypothetical protein